MKNKKKAIVTMLVTIFLLSIASTIFAKSLNGFDSTNSDGETLVTLEENETYIVIIPTTVTLIGHNGSTYSGTGTISVAEGFKLDSNDTLNVKISDATNYANGFKMISTTGNLLDYTVKVGETSKAVNDTVASFTTDSHADVTLTFGAESPTYAGSYSDTITFALDGLD